MYNWINGGLVYWAYVRHSASMSKEWDTPSFIIGKTRIEFRSWISNYIHMFIWDVITHPWPNFKRQIK